MATDRTRLIAQPLVVHFVYHKSDAETVAPLIDVLYSAFSRDVKFPYSHEMNIPMFAWKGDDFDGKITGERLGKKTVVFAFTSGRANVDASWTTALNSLNRRGSNVFVVPIALDSRGVQIPRGVGFNNVISYYCFESEKTERLVLSAAQAICQHCYCPRDAHRQIVPLKVFLSHTKSDNAGSAVVKRMHEFICNETTLGKFFDIHDRQAGESFSDRILKTAKNSIFLAIVSDNYSTRRWCQLEAIEAKRCGIPMLVMHCVTKAEDRILPALSNVPSIRPLLNLDLNEAVISVGECVRVVRALMLESLRCYYLTDRLEALKRVWGLSRGSMVLPRPPESDVLVRHLRSIIYPDPQMLAEERQYYFGKSIDMITPTSDDKSDSLKGMKIGISISDPERGELEQIGLRMESLKRLSQDVAQCAFQHGAQLLYGGDLRSSDQDGFTAFILDEAKIVKNRMSIKRPVVRNYLAWPLYLQEEDAQIEFKSQYPNLVVWKNIKPPKDLAKITGFEADRFVPADTPEHLYCWARSLTAMRKRAVADSECHICAGGKLTNFKGIMPGVVEELLLAVETKRPLYLLGGFGGATAAVVSSILSGTIDKRFTMKWQLDNSLGYSNLVNIARINGHVIDDSRMSALLRLDVKGLARMAGLTAVEYLRLMRSPYEGECVRLIIKGLKKCHERRRHI